MASAHPPPTPVAEPPLPPNQDHLIRWKRSTIQHRNHYNPATKANPERDGWHRRHHPDSWSHLGGGKDKDGNKKKNGKRFPLQENIQNLLIVEEDPDDPHSQARYREDQIQKFKESERLQRHLGPLDEHGRPRDEKLPKPPMHISEIPKNARKPVYNCVGFMGGGSGVADPRKFVKRGSGSKGPVVSDVKVSKPGEEPTKWVRPLAANFVPKMGRPKPGAPKKVDDEQSVNGHKIPKKDFVAANKGAATKVVVKAKAEAPKVLKLGGVPDYLKERRANERFEFQKAETERIERHKDKKKQRKFEKRQRRELLAALVSRRKYVLALTCRAELGTNMTKRKKLEVELGYLDKDIARLEGSGVILIEKKKKKKDKEEEELQAS